MPDQVLGPAGAILLLRMAAITAFVVGGLALVIGARTAAGRLLLLAVFLGVASSFAPGGIG